MNRDEVCDRLQEVFRRCFFNTAIVLNDNMTADDVDGWDSLAHVRLLMMIEDAFQIHVPGADASKLDNVGQLIGFVSRLRNAREQG